ncbi:phosphoglycerate kinase, cytosolic-like isoform X3 [Diospyros lotus]|uniref:phosphoglycerate kinase, cytosolic-like isoform X3 n=1 Tax=Diospyros lotus TaxID=55363 RepID=UPI00225BBABA|nr:phosphoglycerate kinase, cytosolic-like isoform X3 [Diospyros lotus]XP_052176797.1 phosphoglycerate kinase, cytosolic-like isoform X3 [Diospyros lotus]XP_052176798.1 phosphoglycerate kinase, cytosolic-like isoform X3 [Diospyros lotus]XP_052176799.1 phosphoglycerate kinase, cytosolic-like isoform X3 [Diospyros lotus]
MTQILNLLQGTLLHNGLNFYHCPSSLSTLLQPKPILDNGKYVTFLGYRGNRFSMRAGTRNVLDHAKTFSHRVKEKVCDESELNSFPHVQTLRRIPKEELLRKVVMVRFDSTILLHEDLHQQSPSVSNALFTITYLYNAGAKIILVSNWSVKTNSKFFAAESVAEFLSVILQLKVVPAKLVGRMQSIVENEEKSDILLLENLSQFREELANCSKFAELLSAGIDIFVNDAFSQSHRILVSSVGITSFCHACVAGFHFEGALHQLKQLVVSNKKPYLAIIGGSNLLEKAAALHFLASRCDGLVFVGMMAFQIMHVQGLPVPMKLVEPAANEEALNIIQAAKFRSIPILFPEDFWCMSGRRENQVELFPAHCIPDGWVPVDIGPKSLGKISSFLSRSKKILWIGPLKFGLSGHDTIGASKLAIMLGQLNQKNCDITVVGNLTCKAFTMVSSSFSIHNMAGSASVVWEILRGRNLPGLMALDRAYPFEIDWSATYRNPARPLVVDIGSGNGLFLLEMARRRKDLNFLGLEINEKLVSHCLSCVQQSGMRNGYFIATNATSTFRSIISSYPGKLVLVSIQCPDPDFNKPQHCWSMLQRPLIEAIADLLASDGKVFLQSDIEGVAMRMKEQFLRHGKGKLVVMQDHSDNNIGQGGWLKENPFGMHSDWEQHVIDRGAPMYRLILFKSTVSG